MNHPIRKTVQFVLEEWAMMLVDQGPAPREAFSTDLEVYELVCNCDGVFTGNLRLWCQRPFLEALSRNVLGLFEDEELEPEYCYDALRELANIICGNYLTEAYGTDTDFSLPSFQLRTLGFEEARCEMDEGPQGAMLIADEKPLYVSFRLEVKD